MTSRYEEIIKLIATDDTSAWEKLAREQGDFPEGIDDFLHRRWIINAVGIGSAACVRWMTEQRVELNFRDEEGYTPLHAAIDRDKSDKYEVLETLLQAGATVNLKGINDWTPAHMAAARNDVEALKLLVKFGADLSIRTEIDDYATPAEEAQSLGCHDAFAYIGSVV